VHRAASPVAKCRQLISMIDGLSVLIVSGIAAGTSNHLAHSQAPTPHIDD